MDLVSLTIDGVQVQVPAGTTALEAARLAGIPFVHAAYGFGRAERPDAVLERVSDLPALAAELFSSPLFG